MASKQGPLTKLWIQWKSSRLVPWRKRWLVGMDLSGNTFWEFTDQINIGRVRRIVEYDKKAHYADVKLAPQWIQWLRHTREAPPSITEQQMDIVRQAQMKQLAAQADARWASKASAIDMPHRHEMASAALPQRMPDDPPEVKDPVVGLDDVVNDAKEQAGVVERIKKEEKIKRERKDIPYQGLKLGKEGEQAPESWTPRPARRR